MKTIKTSLLSILMLAICCGCAQLQFASKKDVPLPAGTLDAAAVTALFSGQTVESVLDKSGRVSLTYYNPNGELRQLQNGEKLGGSWHVRDDGRICLQIEDGGQKCRIIVKDGPVYRKYIVKLDGNHEPIITYKSFRNGNLVDK